MLNTKQKIYNLNNYLPVVEIHDISQDMHVMKKKVMRYRAIFISLGLLFVTLGSILIFKTSNWHFMTLYGHGISAKILISIITSSFAFASLWIGCHIRTDHEIVKSYFQRNNQRLVRCFQRKRAPFHLQTLLTSLEDAVYQKNLRLFYGEIQEELTRACEEAEHQIDVINHKDKSESLKRSEKEKLLASLKSYLEAAVSRFEKA